MLNDEELAQYRAAAAERRGNSLSGMLSRCLTEIKKLRAVVTAVQEEQDALRAWNQEMDPVKRDRLIILAHAAADRVTATLDALHGVAARIGRGA